MSQAPTKDELTGIAVAIGAMRGTVGSFNLTEFGEDHAVAVQLDYLKVDQVLVDRQHTMLDERGRYPWQD